MSIRVYNPTTNARRNMSVTDYSDLSKVSPEKSLLRPLKKNSGRNSYGRITVRHRGGGNRRKYRVIDFKRNKFDVEATVKSLEYDPNRSAQELQATLHSLWLKKASMLFSDFLPASFATFPLNAWQQ